MQDRQNLETGHMKLLDENGKMYKMTDRWTRPVEFLRDGPEGWKLDVSEKTELALANLATGDARSRLDAVKTLTELEPTPWRAEILAQHLGDPSLEVREHVCQSLAGWGAEYAEVVMEYAEDEEMSAMTRQMAVRTLPRMATGSIQHSSFGDTRAQMADTAVFCLSDTNHKVRREAVLSLDMLTREVPKECRLRMRSKIIKLFRHNQVAVRVTAIDALRLCSHSIVLQDDIFIEMLDDEELPTEVHRAVCQLLAVIGQEDIRARHGMDNPEKVAASLADVMYADEALLRADAIKALGALGVEIAKEQAEDLSEALMDRVFEVRVAAAEALAKLLQEQGPAASATQELAEACGEEIGKRLEDINWKVRAAAVRALGAIPLFAADHGHVERTAALLGSAEEPLLVKQAAIAALRLIAECGDEVAAIHVTRWDEEGTYSQHGPHAPIMITHVEDDLNDILGEHHHKPGENRRQGRRYEQERLSSIGEGVRRLKKVFRHGLTDNKEDDQDSAQDAAIAESEDAPDGETEAPAVCIPTEDATNVGVEPAGDDAHTEVQTPPEVTPTEDAPVADPSLDPIYD